MNCQLAIVGSRIINETLARAIIKTAIVAHKPTTIITTSDSRGVAKIAREEAVVAGVNYLSIGAKQIVWRSEPTNDDDTLSFDVNGSMVITVPGGLMDRNLRVADVAECLVRVAAKGTKTYGSGYTADMAERMGKHVERNEV